MTMTQTGLPEDPEQTFTMVSPAAGTLPAIDLPEPPMWTVAAEATRTVAGAATPSAAAAETNAAVAYRLLRQIGHGSMGEVWEAEQASLGRVIAVKRLRRQAGGQSPDSRLREADFRSESAIAASLEHPNILPVYDFGRDVEGDLLLAMKRVHGTPWKDPLRDDFASMPVDAYLARHIPILMSVTQAVAFAHSRGIIHRDLKPAQVMVGAFGEVLLTDWGLAIEVGSTTHDAMPVTPRPYAFTPDTATNPAGTPAMMAPEQTETHGGNLGPWTDVYLLGGILYYLLCGHYPHASDSSESAFAHARTGRVQAPAERAPDRGVPPELEQLCLKALEPAKADRLASAAEFLQGLEDFQRGTVRKQQSAELAAKVAQQLQTEAPNQAGYTAAIASLDEARRLWSDNPDIAAPRQRALSGSARLALNQGDLSFARLQCDALGDAEQADTLRHDIDVRQRQVARRRTLLRLATAAVFALLVVIAGGALVFSQRMQAANQSIAQHAKETEQALKIAKTRSSGAFSLINFVLNDLKQAMDTELTPEHGVTVKERNYLANAIAGKVAEPVAKYFQEIKPDAWPKDMQTDLADQMNETGQKLAAIDRPQEAIRMLQRSLDLNERIFGDQATETLVPIILLAGVYDQIDKPAQAETLFRHALAIAEDNLPPNDPRYMALLNNLAGLLNEESRYSEAEVLYKRVLAIPEPNATNDSKASRVTHITNLGYVLVDNGKPEEAETLMRKALATWNEIQGSKDDPAGTSFILAALGNALVRQGKYAQAEPILNKALSNAEHVFGPNNRYTGLFTRYLGRLQRLNHQPRKAEASLRHAVQIETGSFGPEHYRTAQALRELGMLLHQTHRDADAEATLRQSLAIFHLKPNRRQVDTAWTNVQLALVLESTGRAAAASALLKQAIQVLQGKLGAQHPRTIAAQKALARIDSRLKVSGS